jgi:intracellular sulfur oxidation DsrE/DsrF family protein
MNTENKEKVINFLNQQKMDIDFRYHLQSEDFDSAEDVRQILEDANAFDVEIIYYSRAMEYLSENDNSLRESLAIAQDMGYEPKNLSSEILASLLASQNVREEFGNIESELQEMIEEIIEEEAGLKKEED